MRVPFLTLCAGAVLILGMASTAQAKSKSYTGCLAAGDSPKEFKLTNVDGGTDEYELVGGKGLKDHVGHKVEIKGKLAAAKEKGEAAHQHLRVSSMKHIAETCP
jgi:hypothetical protein